MTCNYTLKLEDGTVLETRDGFSFVTDENQVPAGLDKAICKMKEGARAIVSVNDPALGFGSADKALESGSTVPANSKARENV